MLSLLEPFAEYLQRKALFRPKPLPADHRFAFEGAAFEEHFLNTPDGARLNLLRFLTPWPQGRGVVLYFHGNRDNLQRWGFLHRDFTARGYDFVVPDYRGYGKSTGQPNERTLYEDARLVYDWVRERYPAIQIELYGRSLGSASACYLAAHVRAHRLILETPFDNIPGLVAAHLGREQVSFRSTFLFPNDRHLRQSPLPALLFHGTDDRVVPLRSAERLRPCLKAGDEFVVIPGGTHHNLRTFDLYQHTLDRWLGHSAAYPEKYAPAGHG
ncbi:MAG: alpha/beta hydrolase [Saprospiraceae bacterium]|nr:alpha/beta hydrolase [Saprospiraceae bacterium]MDW8229093.1 alpha/beta hydrolase [Saprospiraceae bacterium]